MFSKLLIGQGCTGIYYICDIIPYNPDQSGQGWKTIREILTASRPIRFE